tara:strand:+ start:361 stop:579 length:219 start_codon:yes stop_codon:yes gene_type:complete
MKLKIGDKIKAKENKIIVEGEVEIMKVINKPNKNYPGGCFPLLEVKLLDGTIQTLSHNFFMLDGYDFQQIII